MKRSILIFVSLFVLLSYVMAEPVDSTRALQVAKQFIPQYSSSAKKVPKKGAATEAADIVYTHKMPKSGRDAFYIVNVDDAFVLVSADDIAHQILGYSFDKGFPVNADGTVQLPPHIKGFFDDLAAQIEAAIEAEPNRAPSEEWSGERKIRRAPSNLPESVGPLLTTTWDQGQYYNALCPEDVNGPAGHVWTGCVATAMAQIIKYWSEPVHGRGVHSYESNYGILEVNFAESNYDFSNMPDALSGESTAEQVNAVAKLMYDCGVAVNMGYAASESEAFDQEARAGFINFFRFSPDLSFAEKAYFSNEEWDNLLRQNLAANHPVYYSGQGTGSHAFVCDGYKTDDYYHFNFGWGGFADGWFLTSAVSPNGSDFNSSQSAIVGIVPDNTGNVILGQMQGTSTFIVVEPLEFYHLMGHNKYEIHYPNSCNNTVTFIPVDDSKQVVTDIMEFEYQSVQIYDGTNTNDLLRTLYGKSENDLSPVVSSANAITLTYSGNMSYAGFRLLISQDDDCRMVSNISSSVDATMVHLSWDENGNATRWDIEYGTKGFELGSGTLLTANETTITIEGLKKYEEYDFYVRPQCGGSWYGPITLQALPRYWIDMVDSQPEGYSVGELDDRGRYPITISSAEALAWWAKQVINGIVDFRTTVNLVADVDLKDYLWKPIPEYYGSFYGNGHTISNMTIIEKGENSDNSGYGFFRSYRGYNSNNRSTISDLFFQSPTIIIKNASYYSFDDESYYLAGTGVLAGRVFCAKIMNCGVNNGTIIQSYFQPNFYDGMLVGFSDGSIDVINSYVEGCIQSASYNVGGIIGSILWEASNSIINCYSSASITTLNLNGICGSICSNMQNCIIQNCYGIDGIPIVTNYSNSNSSIVDTTHFKSETLVLDDNIYFDGVGYEDLLSVLNKKVEFENDEFWRVWQSDSLGINNGFPILGEKYNIICPNVENLIAVNVEKGSDYAVQVSWERDEQASSWRVKYWESDQPDNTALYVSTETNSIEIDNIIMGKIYNICVRQYYGDTHHSGWGNTIQIMFDKPYWTDIVTSQPEGYIEDSDGNVTITSAEGLAWFSSVVNGINVQYNNIFLGKTITLMSDINLSRYKWRPIGFDYTYTFQGSFNGNNHVISNMYINEKHNEVGLFGRVFQPSPVSQTKFKNVVLEKSDINGVSDVGGLIGLYLGNDIDPLSLLDNCHITNVSINGNNYLGAIIGRCENYGDITIINCSSSGEIHGKQYIGGLLGYIGTGNYIIELSNCYSSCNVYSDSYDGGLIGWVKSANITNCYSTGVTTCVGWPQGKVIGYLCSDISCKYIYGLQDESQYTLIGDINPNYYSTISVSDTTSFSNAGVLNKSIGIGEVSYNNLLSALNAWVDANNSEGQFRHWMTDTENVNGGFPVFAPTYTLTYKVDGEVYKTSFLEEGIAIPTVAEPTKEGYTFGGWSETPETMPDHDVEVTGTFYLYGDVNTDTKVNVVDVVDIARYVVDDPSKSFRQKLADLNKDLAVNIADAVVLVNHIAGDQNFVKAELHISSLNDYESCSLSLQYGEMNDLSLCLTGDADFTAFQFEVDVPEGMNISAMQINGLRKDGHQLLFNKVADNRYRVAALSLSNAVFKGNDGELLNISLEGMGMEDICIHDIHFVTRNGTDVCFENLYINGTETGIADIHDEGNRPVYDLQGRRRSTLQRGVNIVGGKKMIVR